MIEKKGDIFSSRANVLVCPVNCVGTMGAGLAKQFWEKCKYIRAPYARACECGSLYPGNPLLVPAGGLRPFAKHYVCLFPTKNHWRDGSRMEWITGGLEALIKEHVLKDITWAFPLLGAGLGGLDPDAVKEAMFEVLDGKLEWELWTL